MTAVRNSMHPVSMRHSHAVQAPCMSSVPIQCALQGRRGGECSNQAVQAGRLVQMQCRGDGQATRVTTLATAFTSLHKTISSINIGAPEHARVDDKQHEQVEGAQQRHLG